MSPDQPPFFVYGTLRAGQPNAHVLRGAIARARPGDFARRADVGFGAISDDYRIE